MKEKTLIECVEMVTGEHFLFRVIERENEKMEKLIVSQKFKNGILIFEYSHPSVMEAIFHVCALFPINISSKIAKDKVIYQKPVSVSLV